MLFKKYRPIIITFILAWTASFGLAYLAATTEFWPAGKKPISEISSLINQAQPAGKIGVNAKISEQIYFTLCRHLVTRDVVENDELRDMSIDELKSQGWSVYHSDDNNMTVFKKEEGICPACREKRHLGTAGDYVAVYEGPVGVPGAQLEVLTIRVDRLPEEWQEKVKKGELDFSNEKELLEALDSIDEYE